MISSRVFAPLPLPLLLIGLCSAVGQDTRTVREPAFPTACTTLTAQLHASGGSLPDTDEARLDTSRVQAALDTCKPGQAVELAAGAAGNAFLVGPIELRAGVTLLVDRDAELLGSRDPRVYDRSAGSCGVVTKEGGHGCRPLISAQNAPHAAIMGDGVIDGRGGAKMLGRTESWWDLADQARAGGHQQVPRLIDIDRSDDFTLYRITLKNSAMFHVVYAHGDGFTVWGLKIDTPRTARNTDGVDPSASKNITVTHSYIRTGDDNIALKAGDGPVTNMSVLHNHFFYGHGMSIGSETNAGVSRLLVDDLSLDGTESGIRIKSNPTRGGLVDGVIYRDICIRDSNHPIALDTAYNNPGTLVNAIPVYRNIVLEDVRIAGSKTITLNGYDATHRIGIQFNSVVLDRPLDYKFQVKYADILLGPGPVNFVPSGEDTAVHGKPSGGSLGSCKEKFVDFPIAVVTK